MADVVYYGDAANDLAAMTMVGEAVAVSNADAEVLQIADRIIGSAESGAVVLDLLIQLGMPS
jgi:hydroxymethylpyrimidine pyrophosphatase-like HAD family hydrolase